MKNFSLCNSDEEWNWIILMSVVDSLLERNKGKVSKLVKLIRATAFDTLVQQAVQQGLVGVALW